MGTDHGRVRARIHHTKKRARTHTQIPSGSRLEYLLASRTAGGSTTAHIVRVRAARIAHAVVWYQTEAELREALTTFDWEGNDCDREGDRRLFEARKRQLALFSLTAWPGSEAFRAARVAPAVKGLLGRTVLVWGAGLSLRDDRIHVRRELRGLLGEEEEGEDGCGKPWPGMAVREVAVYLPSDILECGLEFLDVPGTGDECPLKFAATCAAVRPGRADAVLAVVGAELTTPVLDMLEISGDLRGLLLEGGEGGGGRWRPVALVHTCGENRANLLNNAGLSGRKGRDAESSLQKSATKSLGKLRGRLEAVYDKLEPCDQTIAGPKAAAVDRAVQAVRTVTVSCLPLLWASNVAHPAGKTEFADRANGNGLLRLLAAVRKNVAHAKDADSNDPIARLTRVLKETAHPCKGGGSSSAAEKQLPAPMAEMYAAFKRRADSAAVAEIQKRVDETVYKPLQNMCKERVATTGIGSGLGADVNIPQQVTRLAATIDAKRKTVLDNAFQRSLGGNYSRFPIHTDIFGPLRLPDSAPTDIQAVLLNLRDDFFAFARTFLVKVAQDVSGCCSSSDMLPGGVRALRGGRDSDSMPGRAAVEAAVTAFLEKGAVGAVALQADFDHCFGRIGGTGGPFGLAGLRRLFDKACRESLNEHMLSPGQSALSALRSSGTSGDRGEDHVKKVLRELVQKRLGAVYKAVGKAMDDGVHEELLKRTEKLYRRLAFGRVRKGGPLVAVSLAQCCLDSAVAAQAAVQAPLAGRAAVEVVQVAAKVAELAQAAVWDWEARPDGVDQLVTRLRQRRLAEWEALGMDS